MFFSKCKHQLLDSTADCWVALTNESSFSICKFSVMRNQNKNFFSSQTDCSQKCDVRVVSEVKLRFDEKIQRISKKVWISNRRRKYWKSIGGKTLFYLCKSGMYLNKCQIKLGDCFQILWCSENIWTFLLPVSWWNEDWILKLRTIDRPDAIPKSLEFFCQSCDEHFIVRSKR